MIRSSLIWRKSACQIKGLVPLFLSPMRYVSPRLKGVRMDPMLSYVRENTEFVDRKLQDYMANVNPLLKVLQESINYTLFSGGKRIRPLFCFVVGEVFGLSRDRLASLACAVEMIHTASLIMDDLPHMDNATTRRGKPANHMIYGQDVAALASIGLLTRAYEVVLNDPGLPDEKKSRVVSKLANVVGIEGMVGGQFVDLKFSNKSIDHATLNYVHTHKTAVLFAASGTTTAIIGDATEAEIRALEVYANSIGFAFQIADDLLDIQGDTKEVGKPLKRDNGNFVMVHGVEKSKQVLQEYANRAMEAIQVFKGKNDKLVALGQMLITRKS
jgi:geranylgeranyl diphosphate synthase type II